MFSVVIPAYNKEKTISKVLDSVRCQTRIDLIDEIIIVNDGSTDRTEQVVHNYRKNHPELAILYIRQSNQGPSVARNHGIKLARGEWIALLDADDVWRKDKIEKQYSVIQSNNRICFLGSCYPLKFLFRKRYSGLVKLNAKQLCIRYVPSTPTVVFRREEGIELGLFNSKMKYCEDINFFQKFLLKDSYYILIEDLVSIGISKKFFNETGLSANLKAMKQGRDQNIRELYEMGLVSGVFFQIMKLISEMKYARRLIIRYFYELKSKYAGY